MTSKIHAVPTAEPVRTFTWLPLPRLPRVPDHFVDRCRQLAVPVGPEGDLMMQRGVATKEYRNRTVIKNNTEYQSRFQEAFDLGPDWTTWVQENINSKFSETSGRLNVGTSTLHGAHVDGVVYRLFYLVDSGGNNAETVFYLKPGRGILYGNEATSYGDGCNNMDELIEIERVKFPVGQWIIFNGLVIHAVENVTGSRININVSVRPEDFDFSIVSK